MEDAVLGRAENGNLNGIGGGTMEIFSAGISGCGG